MASFWSRPLWESIHILALTTDLVGYNNTDVQQGFYNFMESLQKAMPCGSCRDHYKQYIIRHPIPRPLIRSKSLLYFPYTVELHNTVNLRLHKKKYSTEEAFQIFMDKIQQNSSTDSSTDEVQPKSTTADDTEPDVLLWVTIILLLVTILSMIILSFSSKIR